MRLDFAVAPPGLEPGRPLGPKILSLLRMPFRQGALGGLGIALAGGALLPKVSLLDAQETAFLAGVAGVDGFEEALGLDEPGFELFVDVEDQHQVFGFEVAGDGRVVPAALREQRRTQEIRDVAAAGVVDVSQLFAKLREREVPEHGDFAAGGVPRDLGQLVERQAHQAQAGQELAELLDNIDPGSVPAQFRPLLDLAPAWAIGDDLLRHRRLASAPRRELDSFLAAIDPLADPLERWCRVQSQEVPAPVAAVILPGFKPPKRAAGAVTLRGRLSDGFAVHNGIASYLRLERARVSTGFSP